MKLTSTHFIKAPRAKVFAALMDPETLNQCIEGCEKLVQTGDGVYELELRVGVGSIKGKYRGKVVVTDRKGIDSFTLAVDGKGLTGFVRSVAAIRLADKDGGTELVSDAEASVGGMIAAVGSRLVEGLAKKLTSEFYVKLARLVEAAA